MKHNVENIRFIASKSSGEVSGILMKPAEIKYFLLFAHGAGSGMDHPFMEKVSLHLADQGIGTLRYNFPYSEKRKKSPDPASILMETVKSAFNICKELVKDIPVFAGGKSMGGRMTSMAASSELLPGIKGIVFFGFPLHAPSKPSDERAEHLFQLKVPMLFLQGTRDNLADLRLLHPVIAKLNNLASIHIIEGGDHSFQLPRSADKSDVLQELAKKTKEWMDRW